MSLSAGAELGPYEIEGLLGAGGMGEVYRATDPRLGRAVAIKVMPEEVAADSARLSLFEREARAVAALNHPNILTVHDVGTHDGTPYVVTELLEGETLRELVTRRAPTTQQVLTYMLQAARGLEAAHAKNIVHRDLKPENLFLTTDGRVKVLDFGLAKLVRTEAEITSDISTAAHSTPPGQVAGTVLYMSPEQARAQAIDVRSDVFSFGVVLYELLAGMHPFRKDTVAGTLTAIVEEAPPRLESLSRGIPAAIGGIVRRCLEKAREDRYASGHDVAMVLEAVLAAPSGTAALREIEERSPYPGLSFFTEKDAAAFFGREREVEELWRRIPHRKLLAVIGPSGAGKTSFVRAGVLPARPEGWGAIVCTPGAHPFRALGQALGPELAGDTEALGKLAGFEDPDTAVELLGRWQKRHGEALLVVDQFEELVTLNPPEVQERFAALLGRLARAAGVHVLLSLRDDFLIRCVEHEPIAPVLEGLTALLALKPGDLRRAIEEPAKKQGYGFEDQTLIGEMVESVEGARAALPLLAFAVSRLWATRDRERKVLTRAAYEEIGGVAGALAQHAEQTLDRIGSERHGMVRELFRNLVTSQGTRAVADREELLSVFPEREAAEEVLGQLIDARLLTSYETTDELPSRGASSGAGSPLSSRGASSETGDEGSAAPSGTTHSHRIEIVHESLLKAWPRLVRWQAQDEEGALLRDQLKQAAHLWEEKGRSPDVLWSGSALKEYEVWRERYAGHLSALEEEYSRAMVRRAERRRRLRRGVVAAVIVLLAGVAAAIAISRHQVAASRDEARAEARKAEASKLLALAQARLDDDPTEALAFTVASLELADTLASRVFSVRVLSEAPPGIEVGAEVTDLRNAAFSPDGTRLAVVGHSPEALLWREQGGLPVVLPGHQVTTAGGNAARWTLEGLLVTGHPSVGRFVHIWSTEGARLRTIELGAPSGWALGLDHLLVLTREGEGDRRTLRLRSWRLPDGEGRELGRVAGAAVAGIFDPRGRGWLHGQDLLYRRDLPISHASHDRPLGRLPRTAVRLRLPPNRPDRILFIEESGNTRSWTFPREGPPHEEIIPAPAGASGELTPGPTGRWFTADPGEEQRALLWDRDKLPGARPLALRRSGSWYLSNFAFHPGGEWYLALTRSLQSLTMWPLHRPLPSIVDGYLRTRRPVAFSSDGRRLATTWSDGRVRIWSLDSAGGDGFRTIELPERNLLSELVFDPRDRYVFAAGNADRVYVIPLDGKPPRRLEGFSPHTHLERAAVSPSGRFAATAFWAGQGEKTLRVWDLETGRLRPFDLPGARDPDVDADAVGPEAAYEAGVADLHFVDDHTLYTGGDGGLRRWDLRSGSQELVASTGPLGMMSMAMSADGRYALTLDRSMEHWETCRPAVLVDTSMSTTRTLEAFGECVRVLDLHPKGTVAATGDLEGIIRVGHPDRGPHLLIGHEGPVRRVAISPDLKWVASAGEDNTLRLWPMPDLDKPPLHTLPHAALLTKLQSLTNLRAVRDPESSTGWKIEVGPFPGWKEVPEW